MSSQGENSSSLKAGNTKLKGTGKGTAIGANIRYAFLKSAKKGLAVSKAQSAVPKHPNLKWIQILLL